MTRQPISAPLAGESLGEEPIESSGPGNAWKFFVAIALVAILIGGMYTYGSWRGNRQIAQDTYNGFYFRQSAEGFWVTQIVVQRQPYNIPFYNHPRDVADVPMQADATAPILIDRPLRIVIAVDPDASSEVVIAGVEIARITGERYNFLNIPTSSALTRLPEDLIEMPVMSCEDADNRTTVIQFVPGNTSMILRDGPCIRLFYTSSEDSIRVADRYAYRLLQIVY
ncbi:hypothetical protein GOV11_01175 [Candidatus Woesearchaeota archaeon]|nr:hypothetical protein [Candidatus Woesearchaeota archaeon]